jgi:hypothetical protein
MNNTGWRDMAFLNEAGASAGTGSDEAARAALKPAIGGIVQAPRHTGGNGLKSVPIPAVAGQEKATCQNDPGMGRPGAGRASG